MRHVLVVLAVVLAGVFGVLDACAPVVPCSETDTVMLAHQAECIARVRSECANVPDDECPAVHECDEWGNARCGIGQGGRGGSRGAP